MIWNQEQRRIFACAEPVDMRKSFTGLIGAVRQVVEADPLTGDVFLFINRRQSLVKALFWDRTGYCIVSKRLERGRFELRHEGVRAELSMQETQLLFDGIFSRRKRKSAFKA